MLYIHSQTLRWYKRLCFPINSPKLRNSQLTILYAEQQIFTFQKLEPEEFGIFIKKNKNSWNNRQDRFWWINQWKYQYF